MKSLPSLYLAVNEITTINYKSSLLFNLEQHSMRTFIQVNDVRRSLVEITNQFHNVCSGNIVPDCSELFLESHLLLRRLSVTQLLSNFDSIYFRNKLMFVYSKQSIALAKTNGGFTLGDLSIPSSRIPIVFKANKERLDFPKQQSSP